MESKDSSLWKLAIADEYDSLIKNNTWTLTLLPPGRVAIKSRWLFKTKTGAEGTAPRYKARLVAKGYSQRSGIDYGETYAPVAKHDTLRVILSIVAAYDLEMIQLDIKTAFLYGELNEEIYLQQPEGYVAADKENQVCHLHKSLYGLKHRPVCGIATSTLSSRNLVYKQALLTLASTFVVKRTNSLL